jgi:hypothetical protein
MLSRIGTISLLIRLLGELSCLVRSSVVHRQLTISSSTGYVLLLARLRGQKATPPSKSPADFAKTNKGTDGTTGSYNKVKLQPNKTHRLRLINTSLDVALRVSLDGHPFTVIANDFVPVVPYPTNYLLIGIGMSSIPCHQSHINNLQVNATMLSSTLIRPLATTGSAPKPRTPV